MTRAPLLALLPLILASCGPSAPPADDAAPDVVEEPAAPCGGACGPGTVCELNRCVALNVPPPDAAADATPDGHADAAQLDVALDAPAADVASEPACASLTAGNCCGAACEAPNTSSLVCTPAGRCAIGACAPGFGDCDGAFSNGCETNINTSVAHCGACRAPCGDARGCAMGACVSCDRDFDAVRSPVCGGDDCDDNNQGTYPRARERCNGRDDNCDGRPEDTSSAEVLSDCQQWANTRVGAVTWTQPMQCVPIAAGRGEAPPPANAGDTRACFRCFRMGGVERCMCFGLTAMWACVGGV